MLKHPSERVIIIISDALPEETAAWLHDRGHTADKHVGYAFLF
jgi:hypothetical protein